MKNCNRWTALISNAQYAIPFNRLDEVGTKPRLLLSRRPIPTLKALLSLTKETSPSDQLEKSVAELALSRMTEMKCPVNYLFLPRTPQTLTTCPFP